MGLTCQRLMQYDLIESKEKTLDPERIHKFFRLSYEIQNIDSFIRDTPSFPGSTNKIIRNELISVIGATLSIEGTFIDKDEIEESFKKAAGGTPLKRKEQEAENSRKVYEFIKEFVLTNKDNLEYSEQLIKQIHKYFTEDMNYVSNIPGQYRNNFNVTFGSPRKNSLCQTLSDINLAMNNFIKWLSRKDGLGILSQDPFVKAIMAHYYLSEVHPFPDGNGRTARALEAIILYAHGVNDYCFWSLSNFWSSNKDKYIEHLHKIRETLDPINFLLWGLEGYRDEIKSIKDRVLKKVKQLMFSDYLQYLLRNKKNEAIKLNQRIVNVLQFIISRERISFKKLSTTPEMTAFYSSVSQSTRVRDFKKMIFHELINVEEIDKENFIEPNYGILKHLIYNI